MSRIAPLLLVALIVLAGCSGFSANSDEAPNREPYGVEESVNASVDDSPEQLLSGLTTENVTNVTALREAHREALDNESYTVRMETEYNIYSGNTSDRQVVERTLFVDPEAGAAVGETHIRTAANESNLFISDPSMQSSQQWYGENRFSRVQFQNGTVEYVSFDDGSLSTKEYLNSFSYHSLGPLQDPDEVTTLGAVDAEDGTYYVLEDQKNDTPEIAQPASTNDTEVQTLIRDDGLARQTIYEYVIERDNERTVVNRTVELTDIGETTVERPDWYEEATETVSNDSDASSESGDSEQEALQGIEPDRTGSGVATSEFEESV